MGMFDAFFQGRDDSPDFIGSTLGQFVGVCIKQNVEVAKLTNKGLYLITDDMVKEINEKNPFGARIEAHDISNGISTCIALLAATFYYHETGMLSRTELIELLGGKQHYDALKPLFEGMGKESVRILKEIQRGGID